MTFTLIFTVRLSGPYLAKPVNEVLLENTESHCFLSLDLISRALPAWPTLTGCVQCQVCPSRRMTSRQGWGRLPLMSLDTGELVGGGVAEGGRGEGDEDKTREREREKEREGEGETERNRERETEMGERKKERVRESERYRESYTERERERDREKDRQWQNGGSGGGGGQNSELGERE